MSNRTLNVLEIAARKEACVASAALVISNRRGRGERIEIDLDVIREIVGNVLQVYESLGGGS